MQALPTAAGEPHHAGRDCRPRPSDDLPARSTRRVDAARHRRTGRSCSVPPGCTNYRETRSCWRPEVANLPAKLAAHLDPSNRHFEAAIGLQSDRSLPPLAVMSWGGRMRQACTGERPGGEASAPPSASMREALFQAFQGGLQAIAGQLVRFSLVHDEVRTACRTSRPAHTLGASQNSQNPISTGRLPLLPGDGALRARARLSRRSPSAYGRGSGAGNAGGPRSRRAMT